MVIVKQNFNLKEGIRLHNEADERKRFPGARNRKKGDKKRSKGLEKIRFEIQSDICTRAF